MSQDKIDRNCQQCASVFAVFPRLIAQGRGKYCSPKCHNDSRRGSPIGARLPERLCPQCSSPTGYRKRAYCSEACRVSAREARRDTSRVCPCGAPLMSYWQKKFCSHECHNLARRQEFSARSAGRLCRCGQPLKPNRLFCSTVCFNQSHPVRSCATCGIQIRSQAKYCSPSCTHAGFRQRIVDRQLAAGRICACGNTLNRKQAVFCSVACRYAAEPPPKARAYDDILIKMAASGATWKDIVAACGACLNVLYKRCKQLGIKKICSPRQPKVKQGRSTLSVRPVKSPVIRPAAPTKEATRPPIQIHLREIYQHAFTLDLPRDKRGDLDALNRAMRRENPAHPGFVLADRKVSRVGLYAR